MTETTKQVGELVTWRDDAGFGFIRPDDGADDVFLHQKQLGASGLPEFPTIGDRFEFEAHVGHGRSLEARNLKQVD